MTIEAAAKLQHRKTVDADVFRGPFDPGGQPSLEQEHPLHISLFAWTVRSATVCSKAVLTDPQRYRDFWRWPASRELLRAAERAGFDSQIQYAMWSGYGGATDWNGASLDWATAAAASAAVTERLGLFTTLHVGFGIHPMVFAKTTAAIDHVSDGRLGVNIVAATDLIDYAQFGLGKDRDAEAVNKGLGRSSAERYAITDEFTTLLKYLWTSDEAVNFEGTYFQAYGAHIDPKPTSSPRPLLMSAASSDMGVDFATRQCDAIFVGVTNTSASDEERNSGYKEMAAKVRAAAALHGRKVRICANCFIVMDETDAKAAKTFKWLEDELDTDALANFFGRMRGNAIAPAELDKESSKAFGIGLGGYQLVGSYATIANKLADLHGAGIDHVALVFWDMRNSIDTFAKHVMPLLRERGLRNT